MPMHDWTKVSAGVYHNFRYLWLASIMDRLNAGLLPKGLFAMAEQGVDDPEDDLTMTDQLWYARKSNRIAIPGSRQVARVRRLAWIENAAYASPFLSGLKHPGSALPRHASR